MPKVISATCNKKAPVGARLVKKAFPEESPRKGYFVTGGAPVVKLKRGSAKGCVRSARPNESKRIRQARRGEIQRTSAKTAAAKKPAKPAKKASAKKASAKKASAKKSPSAKKASAKKSKTFSQYMSAASKIADPPQWYLNEKKRRDNLKKSPSGKKSPAKSPKSPKSPSKSPKSPNT
jgi:hypothetical protein